MERVRDDAKCGLVPGGRSSCGNFWREKLGNRGGLQRLRARSLRDEDFSLNCNRCRFHSLVAQVTDGACLRRCVHMVVPHLTQRHPDNERQNGDRDHEPPERPSI